MKNPPKVGKCAWCGHWGLLHGRWCKHWDLFHPRRLSDCQKSWRRWVWEKNSVVKPFRATRQWIDLETHRCRGLATFLEPWPVNCGRMKKRLLHD